MTIHGQFRWFATAFCGLALFGLAACTGSNASEEKGKGQATRKSDSGAALRSWTLNESDSEWDGQIDISISPQVASFLDETILNDIVVDMEDYFQKSNEMDWEGAMGHHPLHRQPDTAFIRKAVEVMTKFSDMGLRNRTERVEILYASEMVDDEDQEVVLLNMELVHFVDFNSTYEGNVEGMKGMVESNYGKGNATYHVGEAAESDSLPPFRYWEVRGQSRIWALSAKDSSHWCFLPANFNEGGGGNYMSGTAMVEALRHRREFDPNYQQK
jgi:hypothetical protein